MFRPLQRSLCDKCSRSSITIRVNGPIPFAGIGAKTDIVTKIPKGIGVFYPIPPGGQYGLVIFFFEDLLDTKSLT